MKLRFELSNCKPTALLPLFPLAWEGYWGEYGWGAGSITA